LTTYRYVEPYTLAGLFYLVVSYASSVLLRRLEYKHEQS
jgi:polar amino acid transport system permease protein